MPQTLADRLQLVIKARGYESPYEWSQRAGLSDSTVANIITRGSGARTVTLQALAQEARVPFEWLASGNGPSGLEADGDEGPRVEREPQPAYSESEAPYLFNTAGWDQVVRAAMDLEGADRVPTPFFEMAGYVNEVMTGPPTPDGILTVAKTVMRFRTVEQAERLLEELRAKHGRPPLRRGAAAKPAKGRAQ